MFEKTEIAILLVVFVVKIKTIELPCHFHQSVNITDGVEYSNGSIFYNGFEYTAEQYGHVDEMILPDHSTQTVEEHPRGCICQLKDSKPCIQFCCPPGFIKKGDHSGICQPSDHEVYFNNSNADGYEEFNVNEKFIIISMKKCDLYLLDEDKDPNSNWKLLESGSLYYSDEIWEYDSFCIDQVLLADNSTKTSVAICFGDDSSSELNHKKTFEIIVMIISMVFLVLTFLVFVLIPDLQNLRGKCLMSYMIAAFLFFSLLCLTNGYVMEQPEFCIALGFAVYASLLLVFFMMNSIAIEYFSSYYMPDLKERSKEKTYRWLMLYGIGATFFIVSLAAFIDFTDLLDNDLRPKIGHISCFLHDDRLSMFIYLYSILTTLIVVNIILFILTGLKIWKASTETSINSNNFIVEETNGNDFDRENFFQLLTLFIVIDLLWIFEVLSWIFEDHIPEMFIDVFVFMTHLQGVWIFIACVCRPQVFILIKKKWTTENYSKTGSDKNIRNFSEDNPTTIELYGKT